MFDLEGNLNLKKKDAGKMQIQALSAEFSPVFSAPFAKIVEKSTSTRCHVCSESESLPKHSNSNHGGGRVGRRFHTSISPVQYLCPICTEDSTTV